MEDDFKFNKDNHVFCWENVLAQPQQASQLEPELGTAQPQLVFYIKPPRHRFGFSLAWGWH
jgi:hypothetical protein